MYLDMERQRPDKVVGALDQYPMLDGVERLYFKAFCLLSETRSYGMGANPIDLKSMAIYHETFYFPDPFSEFIEIIHALDNKWVSQH